MSGELGVADVVLFIEKWDTYISAPLWSPLVSQAGLKLFKIPTIDTRL